MPAPEGNQYALGNNGGAPRTYDRVQIANDLIEWSESPEALKYTMFARYLKQKRNILFNVTRLNDWADEDKEFAESLSIAKQNIDINRFNAACDELMPEDFYKRCESQYDENYQRHSRKEKKFESDLKKEAEGRQQGVVNVYVDGNGLASGASIRTKTLPASNNKSAKSRD